MVEHSQDQLSSSLYERFQSLAQEWRTQRPASSYIDELVNHPAYKNIIKLGQPIVPLIIAEFKREPDHWAPALCSIVGEDPVPESAAGDLKKMAEAWFNWGIKQRYNI